MSNAAPFGEDFLTTAQVAEVTGWSVTSINRWAAAGSLPGRKLPGRTGAWLFHRNVVEMFRRQKTAA